MSLPLHIVTIVLDGMPFLPMQLATFNRLTIPWTWHVVEGVADNVACTKWCAKLSPRLSVDGTTEFLHSLRNHPRVRLYQRQLWNGKREMFNTALETISEFAFLMEVDVDELWTPEQIEGVIRMFERTRFEAAQFRMRYFVGHNIVTISSNGYGNRPGEWLRAWRFRPGDKFISHEPPMLTQRLHSVSVADREITAAMGLVPDHWAYVFRHQVEFKEEYYQYKDAVAHWEALQNHTGPWPVALKMFLPWVTDNTVASPLFE